MDSADAWVTAPRMTTARCALGADASLTTSAVYAVGGYGGDRQYLSSVEYLDINSERWILLPEMTVPRAGCFAGFGPDGRFGRLALIIP